MTNQRGCWSKRTNLEKQLIVLLVMSLTALVIIVLLHIFKGNHGDVCTKPSCILAAARVINRMDFNVDPCDDFYKFACGNFVNNTFIPDDLTQISSLNMIDDTVSIQVKSMLDRPIDENDKRPESLVKTLYKTCMDTKQIEENSDATVKRILKSTGGWPVLDKNWDESDFDWIDTGHKFMSLGLPSTMLIHYGIGIDLVNSSKCALQLDQAQPVAFQKQMREGFSNPVVAKFYDYLFKLAISFGADRDRAEKDMKEVIELFIVMNNITILPEERRDLTKQSHYMDVDKLQIEFPYIQWKPYWNTVLFPRKLKDDDVIDVHIPDYYKKLETVIKTTSRRTLSNYMHVRALQSIIPYLKNSIRELYLDFTSVLTGVAKSPPKWKECSKIAAKLPAAIGALYVKNFFNEESKETMMEIVNNVRDELVKTLSKVQWMDEKTRENALEKANAIKIYMAYPDEVLDEEKVAQLYNNLTLNSTDYLLSMLNLEIADRLSDLILLDTPTVEHMWIMHSATTSINAFYYAIENSIDFRASILQDVFFDNDRPQYMNYGSIGFAIGHELTHGFDDKGRQFDKEGNLFDWWQPATITAFEKKAQCMIEQYGNITVPEVDLNLNGVLTQGENIADNGGVKEAYRAYEKWVQTHGNESKLPGLPYNPQQMFWISFASTWCTVQRPETLKMDIAINAHTPSHYRINLPLMNSELFSKDFKCPVGSRMNPVEKCEVW